MVQFAIISVGRNCAKYIKSWHQSIINQSNQNWRCYVAIDPSDDKTMEVTSALVDDRFSVQVNSNRQYCLRNTYDCIAKVTNKETVIVTLDLDDAFSNSDVIDILAKFYADTNDWLTYGSYRDSNGNPGNWCKPISDKVWQTNSHRKGPWSASALRTFKKWLWDLIDPKDFLMPDGSWIKRATDRSFMYPMLEMAGKQHVRFIQKVLYIYNIYGQQPPLHDVEMGALKHILSKHPYKTLKGKP